MGGMFGGGGSKKQPVKAQRAVTAQKPETVDLTDAERRNRRLAASFLTSQWGQPANVQKTGLIGI